MSDTPNPLQVTLKSQTFIIGSALIWLLSGILYVNIAAQQKQHLEVESALRNATIISIATSYVAPLLQTRNVISLNVFLKNLVSRPDIYSGQIIDSTGGTVTEYTDERAPGITLNEAIQFDSQLIGYIRLEVQPIDDLGNWALTVFLWALLIQVFWGLFSLQRSVKSLAQWHSVNRHLKPIFGSAHFSAADWEAEFSGAGRQHLTAINLLQQRLSTEQLPLLSNDPDLTDSQFHTAIVLFCAPTTESLAPKSANADVQHDTIMQLETWIEHIAELYQGHRLENGLYIAFGLGNDDADEAAVNALCAARVLYFLSRGQLPLSISIAAGSFWTGSGAAPWPITHANGPVFDDLDYVHLHHDGELILLTESLFQYAVLNERLQASIYRDVITADGRRLEVWQLDGLQGQYDNLLLAQADRLRNLDLARSND